MDAGGRVTAGTVTEEPIIETGCSQSSTIKERVITNEYHVGA